MDTIEVYYVTAARRGGHPDEAAVHAAVIAEARSGASQAPAPPAQDRTDMGKFFTRADAEAHSNLGPGWYDVRVERRVEKTADQHKAHLIGPPAR